MIAILTVAKYAFAGTFALGAYVGGAATKRFPKSSEVVFDTTRVVVVLGRGVLGIGLGTAGTAASVLGDIMMPPHEPASRAEMTGRVLGTCLRGTGSILTELGAAVLPKVADPKL